MTDIIRNRRRAARHLFLGSARIALATMLISPQAQAQVAGVQSTASRAVVSDQVERGAVNIADGSTLVTLATPGPVGASTATLSDNVVSATTRGNKASLNLSPDAVEVPASAQPTHLAAGADGIVAAADMVIAASQRNQGTVNGALLDAATKVALEAGAVTDGALAVDRNSQGTVALGNDGSANLSLTGGNAGGAGIASLQAADGPTEESDDTSPVGAHSYGQTALGAGAVSGSALSLSGNLERALGYGNATDNALSVTATGVNAVARDGTSVVSGSVGGGAWVDAGYAVLSSQSVGAAVKARAGQAETGPAFVADVAGLSGSLLASDDNTLAAAGYGNQSANRVDIAAVSIAPSSGSEGPAGGAVANVTGIQRMNDDGRVIATTYGGAVTGIAGDVDASSVSGSHNNVTALAVGNRADGNLLTVRADSIDTSYGDSASGAVETALVGADGTASTAAALSVQNVQDSGQVAISAAQLDSRTNLTIGGAVTGAAIVADGNAANASATRNGATNGVTITATDLRASAGLDTLQTGGGSLVASLGSAADPGGAVIAIAGPVSGSSLAVRGNSLAGAATGNSAVSTMSVTGGRVADGSGNAGAKAGALPDGVGATATFALANQQRLGAPGTGTATPVVSRVFGRFAAAADDAEQSSLIVADNLQQSTALGSNAVNRLSVSATSLDGEGSPAPGSALSSVQYGKANVAATSNMDADATGSGHGLSVSIAGDTSQASAAINQVGNGLSVSAVRADGVTGDGAIVSTDPFGVPTARGDHVLASRQVAAGSASATASTLLLAGGTGDLDTSNISISGNSNSADASANRALNSVSVATAAEASANAGLANSQRSTANVTASAVTDADYGGAYSGRTAAVDRSPVNLAENVTTSVARGNVADNQLSLTGGNTGMPAMATANDGSGAALRGSAALLNDQVNRGAVAASADTRYGIPLNGAGTSTMSSTLGVTGNSISAIAYGNASNNMVTVASLGGLPTAALVSSQANYGPVSAQVTGGSNRILSGPVTGGLLSLTSNQITAAATGNLATSAITAAR